MHTGTPEGEIASFPGVALWRISQAADLPV